MKVETGTILGALSGVLTLVAVFAMMAIVIVTEVLIIMRFYRLLGDDGYFWFSLPVTPAQHMAVKLIAAHGVVCGKPGIVRGRHFRVRTGSQRHGGRCRSGRAVGCSAHLPLYDACVWFRRAAGAGRADSHGRASCLQVQLACALGMQWPQSRLGASIGMYVLISVVLQILWTVATVGGRPVPVCQYTAHHDAHHFGRIPHPCDGCGRILPPESYPLRRLLCRDALAFDETAEPGITASPKRG